MTLRRRVTGAAHHRSEPVWFVVIIDEGPGLLESGVRVEDGAQQGYGNCHDKYSAPNAAQRNRSAQRISWRGCSSTGVMGLPSCKFA
eukprot:9486178-Pyramimonas_sp.AAC.2